MYLVDTNVLSATAPTKAAPGQELPAWMDRNSAALYVSVITVAEVEDGIAKSRRTGAETKARHLADWLETVLHLYGRRILPLDVRIARRVGALAYRARARGQNPGLANLAIAATAQVLGCTILTQNLRHFTALEVPALNPFEALPDDMILPQTSCIKSDA